MHLGIMHYSHMHYHPMHLKCIWDALWPQCIWGKCIVLICIIPQCIWNAFGMHYGHNAFGGNALCSYAWFLQCIVNALLCPDAFKTHSAMHSKCIISLRCIWNAFGILKCILNAFENPPMHFKCMLGISNAFQMHLRRIMHVKCIMKCIQNASEENHAFAMHLRPPRCI